MGMDDGSTETKHCAYNNCGALGNGFRRFWSVQNLHSYSEKAHAIWGLD